MAFSVQMYAVVIMAVAVMWTEVVSVLLTGQVNSAIRVSFEISYIWKKITSSFKIIQFISKFVP